MIDYSVVRRQQEKCNFRSYFGQWTAHLKPNRPWGCHSLGTPEDSPADLSIYAVTCADPRSPEFRPWMARPGPSTACFFCALTCFLYPLSF